MLINDIERINYKSDLSIKRVSYINYIISYDSISSHLLAYNELMKIISGINKNIVDYVIIKHNNSIILVSRLFADFIKSIRESNHDFIEVERSSLKNLQYKIFYSKLSYKDYIIDLYMFDNISGLDIIDQFIDCHKKGNIFNNTNIYRLDIFTSFEFVYRFASNRK